MNSGSFKNVTNKQFVYNSYISNMYLIKQYKYLSPIPFCIYPFESLHRFYDIRRELANKHPMIHWFPSTFCPILGHHPGCVYYKSDVTFARTLPLLRIERLF